MPKSKLVLLIISISIIVSIFTYISFDLYDSYKTDKINKIAIENAHSEALKRKVNLIKADAENSERKTLLKSGLKPTDFKNLGIQTHIGGKSRKVYII
jgi:hypothetical protein